MTQTVLQKFIKLAPLALLVVGLLTYNFMSAQWQSPTATAPNNNTEAPINISANYQAKLGDLGAVRMRAGEYCDAAGLNCVTSSGVGGGTWGTWTNVTASRPGNTWHQNIQTKAIMVHFWTNSGAGASVATSSTGVGAVTVASPDGDSGEWGNGTFIVPPGHWYRIGSSVRTVSELVMPF